MPPLEPTTVYWYNGACYSCASRKMRRNVMRSWCAGCGREVGGWGYGPEDRAATTEAAGQGAERGEAT